MTQDFAALGANKYVALTTFKRSGERVSTAMWVAADGDAIVFSTHADSGKVKRIRNSGAVEVAPSTVSGTVDAAMTSTPGIAVIVPDGPDRDRAFALLRRKYGWQGTMLRFFERFGKAEKTARVIVRVTAA